MSKIETIVNRLHTMAHSGELDEEGFIQIGPKLGVKRKFTNHGIYDEESESDESYRTRLHDLFRSRAGMQELEKNYEISTHEERRDLGRTINSVRRR